MLEMLFPKTPLTEMPCAACLPAPGGGSQHGGRPAGSLSVSGLVSPHRIQPDRQTRGGAGQGENGGGHECNTPIYLFGFFLCFLSYG